MTMRPARAPIYALLAANTLAFIADTFTSLERLVGMSNDIWLPPR